MLNKVIIVGKLRTIVIDERINTDYGYIGVQIADNLKEKSYTEIEIAVPNNMINNIKDYCTINETIGIHGHLTDKDDITNVVADRITFLESKSANNEER